jgi:hypothetical protein
VDVEPAELARRLRIMRDNGQSPHDRLAIAVALGNLTQDEADEVRDLI